MLTFPYLKKNVDYTFFKQNIILYQIVVKISIVKFQ